MGCGCTDNRALDAPAAVSFIALHRKPGETGLAEA